MTEYKGDYVTVANKTVFESLINCMQNHVGGPKGYPKIIFVVDDKLSILCYDKA